MNGSLRREPLADAHLVEEVDGWLFQHSGADPVFDVVAVAGLENHGIDALQVQQVGQCQPRRSGADHRDLLAHGGLLR